MNYYLLSLLGELSRVNVLLDSLAPGLRVSLVEGVDTALWLAFHVRVREDKLSDRLKEVMMRFRLSILRSAESQIRIRHLRDQG